MLSFFPRDVLDEILNLNESISEGFPSYSCVYINKLFTPFRTYRRKRMPMNNLAIAENFFLFIEVPGKFQIVYGTFWIELFLACHRTFGIFLIRARI